MSNMVINTNVLALNAHRSMKKVGELQNKASSRLASGLRINSAADDAAGLAISEKMRAQIRGLDQASKNSQDAVSLIQTAEGGMQEVDNMLQRIRELVVQASNDTNENNYEGTGDRQKIQDEISQLVSEIDSMAGRVEFNKKRLIDGSFQDTKNQLSTAMKELGSSTTQQAEAGARIVALNTELTTAQTNLATAQTAADAGVAAYKTATGTYVAEQTTFNAVRDEYNMAIVDLQKTLDAASIADVSVLNDNMFDPALTTYIGPVNSTNIIAAVNRYVAAADAYGLDGLALQDNTAFTTAAADPAAVAYAGAPAVTKLASDPLEGARATWDTAKADFAAADATYKGLLYTRDVAQQKINSLNATMSDSLKSVKRANAAVSASNIKFDAAYENDSGSSARPLYFQVGANAMQGIALSIGSIKSDTLGIGDGNGKSYLDIARNTGYDTTSYLDTLDKALSYVTTQRSLLGAAQNRLEYTMKSLDISSENLAAAESRVRDTDMAKEMMNLTKANVLQQAATAMLAQANQAPQNILQLLR